MTKVKAFLLILMSFAIFLSISKFHLPLSLSLFSALAFWTGIGALLFPRLKWGGGKFYWITFLAYFIYHSLVYALVLGIIEPGGITALRLVSQIHLGYGFEVPPPLKYFPYWISQSPAFWIIVGGYEADVVPYTIFMGLLLGNLMGLNVSYITRLGLLRRRMGITRSLLVLPSVGVVSGASCCLALPTIILYTFALSIPSIASPILLVLSSPTYFIFVYYGLPVLSALALYVNLRLVSRMVLTCERQRKLNPDSPS